MLYRQHWHIGDIYQVYQVYTNVKVYTWYIPGIYHLYLWYIPGYIPGILVYTCYIQVYDQLRGLRDWYRTSASRFLCGIYLLCRRHWLIVGIYLVYTWYIPTYKNLLPGGWCCGGGQGPIPPVPPATTSPGLVITLHCPRSDSEDSCSWSCQCGYAGRTLN